MNCYRDTKKGWDDVRISPFSTRFWGIYFILIGSAAIIKTYTSLHVPIIQIAIALLFIWTGLVVILGRGFHLDMEPGTILLESEGHTIAARSGEYNSVLASGTFEIQEPNEGEGLMLEINAVLGMATVHVPSDVPFKVKASSAFGSVVTPDGTSTFFGERTYTSKDYSEASRFIRIKASAVFGTVQIVGD